jgi:hypothetical protein
LYLLLFLSWKEQLVDARDLCSLFCLVSWTQLVKKTDRRRRVTRADVDKCSDGKEKGKKYIRKRGRTVLFLSLSVNFGRNISHPDIRMS